MIRSIVILIIIKIIHLEDECLSCEYIYTREMTLFLQEDMFGKLLRYRDTGCRKRHSSPSVVWQTQRLFLIKMWRRGRERISEMEKVRNKLGRDVSLPRDDMVPHHRARAGPPRETGSLLIADWRSLFTGPRWP